MYVPVSLHFKYGHHSSLYSLLPFYLVFCCCFKAMLLVKILPRASDLSSQYLNLIIKQTLS